MLSSWLEVAWWMLSTVNVHIYSWCNSTCYSCLYEDFFSQQDCDLQPYAAVSSFQKHICKERWRMKMEQLLSILSTPSSSSIPKVQHIVLLHNGILHLASRFLGNGYSAAN